MLDDRIRNTYVANSRGVLQRSIYDSYIRAIRWGTDRIGDAGIMAYVTNAGWVDGNAADGVRACLAKEYSDLFIFHLRGNANTSGERRKKEKGNVFGAGSKTPISINILVKNPNAKEHGRIHFYDIGDYLDREQKLSAIKSFGSLGGITEKNAWLRIAPNEENDWVDQRDANFSKFPPIGAKRGAEEVALFENFTLGVMTSRDTWCFNASKDSVSQNIRKTIDFYNSEVARLIDGGVAKRAKDLVSRDSENISWSRSLLSDAEKGRLLTFDLSRLVLANYRPFTRQWMYFDRRLNEMVYQMNQIFPVGGGENLAISLTAARGKASFSSLMIGSIAGYCIASTPAGSQCFPLYLYDQEHEENENLFSGQTSGFQRRDAITDTGLKYFQAAYPGEEITKEDIFYYVYGLLHSEEYRSRYADNLSKELPRIPCVKKAEDFWAFSRAGRALGDLHVNYESVEPYPVTIKQGDLRTAVIKDPEAFYRVTKMKFTGKRGETDKTTIIYNANITMQDIPLEAYDYVVNGKPALEWVMERQVVKTDKASGIVNDANRYAIETMGNPSYPLELFQRVITVSLETMKIVRALPKLELPE